MSKKKPAPVDPILNFFALYRDHAQEKARRHAPGSIENVNQAKLAEAAAILADGTKSSWHPPAVGNTRAVTKKKKATEYVDPNPEASDSEE